MLFFLTVEIILSSCTLVAFCGLSGLLVFLSSSFFLIAQHCSFGKMSSDMFILFFSLVMVSFTCTVISLDFPNMESSSEWLQNAFITIRINSRCLICLICDEIITSHESVYWQIIQLIGTLFKNCKLLMEHFCQTPWIKSKTLQFNHILIVWCILGSVQRQNYKKMSLHIWIWL